VIIGIPKEIKKDEQRVAMLPDGVEMLCRDGHHILVEKGAGQGSGFEDESYLQAGAELVEDPQEIYSRAEMIIKVKEPQETEFVMMREGQILFTYLHLAAEPRLTNFLLERKITAIGYETVQINGYLPLLTPMSEIAGRMATQIGARLMEKKYGGRGILIGGVTGVPAAEVVILGAGTVGSNAARVALGMGAHVTVLDRVPQRLRELSHLSQGQITTFVSRPYNIEKAVKYADLVISAVLVPGGKTPCLITEEMVKKMKPGSVIIDVSIDQGGAVETIRATSHSNPTFIKHGVVHYAVPNIPGAVPRTSTVALTNGTLPYIQDLAGKGFKKAVLEDPALAKGVNTYRGAVVNEAVAMAHALQFTPLEKLL
jgi:alanine dehydrogenase